MVWIVELYINNRNDRPVSEFLHTLDDATYDKTTRLIDLLVKYGPQITPPYSKRINKRISELRTMGKNQVRILYCSKDGKFVLLHAFKKKTNKLPTKELKLAESRLNKLRYILES